MECTQRIECTQDISYIASQRICPQQIGFLGISGEKYPLNKGPNKIGRDPKTCNIVLDFNTISRQHAVINIMNDKNFVLMDLESSNKTKLMGTSIQPYTPHALKNGDTVQFGDVLGIFRLLEEVDDLPLTQAVDIPATPVNIRHGSRTNAHIKTVPETPDVSGRDESIIDQSPRRSSNNNLIRSPRPLIGSNKIDNVYWNSSKKSDSFSRHFETNSSKLQDTKTSVSPKKVSGTQNNIFDMETQQPDIVEDDVNVSIYEAETQPDVANKVTLPKVFKVQDQNNVQLNLYATDKKNVNIHEAETQITLQGEEESTSKVTVTEPEKPPDDEDLTDFEDDMIELQAKKTEPDIASKIDDDDTDCEDEIIEISQNRIRVNDTFHNPEVADNFEDLPTQVIGEIERDKEGSKSDNVGLPFEDILTQVIQECPDDNANQTRKEIDSPLLFEDLQTQVIEKDTFKEPKSPGLNAMFKVPCSPRRLKRKEISPTKPAPILTNQTDCEKKDEDDANYYVNTQQVFDDLCSQSIMNGYDLDTNADMDTNNLSIDTLGKENSSDASDGNDNLQCIVSNLSKEQVRDVIGVDTVDVAPLTKKISSDSSDLEITPKKFNPSKFLMIDLPNSQEIKSCKFVTSKVSETELSDGFEETEEQDDVSTSNVCHGINKRRNVKQDLSKKFDVSTLPTRAITRIRKCTSKLLDSDEKSRKKSEKILESKLGLGNEIEIDNEVIQFNLARLRKKAEKEKNKQRKNSTEDPVGNEKSGPKVENEKVLRQQNIVAMLKTEPKKIKLIDAIEIIPKSEPSSKKQRSSRSKNKIEETVTKVEEANAKGRGRKKTSRENIVENFDLTIDKPLIPRRSKRNHAPVKIEEVEKTRKSRKKRDNDKSNEEYKSSNRNSNDTKSTNNKHSVSLNKSSERNQSTSYSERPSSSTNSPKSSSSTEKPRNNKQKRERTETDKKPSTSRTTNRSTNHEENTNTVVSGSDLKRQPSSELMHPPSKRTKVVEESSRPKSSRGVKIHYVVFTAFMSDPVVEKLKSLGAVVVSEVKSSTVVLTNQLKRTCKLLCAVGLGKPIVGLDWVQACSDAQMIVDPWLYLIKDEAMERRQKFNLQQSITCSRNFLREYKVSCTPNAKPSADELKDIVECSGGKFGEGGAKWLCLSCPADEQLWPALRRRGARMIDTETFLSSIMRQKLDVGRGSLSSSRSRT